MAGSACARSVRECLRTLRVAHESGEHVCYDSAVLDADFRPVSGLIEVSVKYKLCGVAHAEYDVADIVVVHPETRSFRHGRMSS